MFIAGFLLISFFLYFILADLRVDAKDSPNPLQQISYIRDDETEKFLKDISTSIFNAAGLDPDSIKIIIINDPTINAFVASGQKLFLNTGLIVAADEVSGLMGVMAHETGHIKGAHVIIQSEVSRGASLGSIAGYVLGLGSVLAGAPPEAGMAIGSAGQNIAARKMLAYSRSYENAADTVALTVLKKIGISPMGLVNILRKLQAKQKISGDISDPYLLTHPVTDERINYILNFVRDNPGVDKPTPPELEQRFKMVKAKVMGFLEEPDKVKLYYQGQNGPDAFYAEAISLHKEAKFKESMALVQKLIDYQPDNPYFTELKAQFLFEQGNVDESVTQYKKALAMLGNSPLIRLKLSESLLATKSQQNWQEATGHLKAIIAQEPKNLAALEKLGLAYGKLGKIGLSYLYLTESSIVAGDKINAKRYMTMAERNIDDKSPDNSKLEELKKELDQMKDK